MLPLLLLPLLLAGRVESAVVAPTPVSGTAPAQVQKREPLITRFATVFSSGDPTKERTANGGFECRVDLDRSLWGFCPTTVLFASDCGLAGNCVDRHSCSKGCGRGPGLTTFTWYVSCVSSDASRKGKRLTDLVSTGTNGEFCTTAELYLTNGIGPFSYIGCGSAPTTDRYWAFTTNQTTKAAPTPSSDTTFSRVIPSPPVVPTETSGPLTPAPDSNSSSNNNTSTTGAPVAASNGAPNNTLAIIGGIVGCVALLCVSGIVVIWLLKRRRDGNKAKALAEQQDRREAHETKPPPQYHAAEKWAPHEVGADPLPIRELGGHDMRSPVELPAASPRFFRFSRRMM